MPEAENIPEPSPAPEPKLFFVLDSRIRNHLGLNEGQIRYRIRGWLMLAVDCAEVDAVMNGFYNYEMRFLSRPADVPIYKEDYDRPAQIRDVEEISAWTSRCYNIPVVHDAETNLFRHPTEIEKRIVDPQTGYSHAIPNGVSTYEISPLFGFSNEEVEAGIDRLIELKLAQ
jgi:hypothetical protein